MNTMGLNDETAVMLGCLRDGLFGESNGWEYGWSEDPAARAQEVRGAVEDTMTPGRPRWFWGTPNADFALMMLETFLNHVDWTVVAAYVIDGIEP